MRPAYKLRRAVRQTLSSTPALNRPLTTTLRRLGPDAIAWGERRFPRLGVAEVESADGSELLLHGGDRPDWVTQWLFWRGLAEYEPEVLPVYASLCRAATNVVDAGANIGIYSLLAASVNPTAKILAFEPVSEIYGVLSKNLTLNNARNVYAVRAGLGDATNRIGLFSPAGRIDTTASSNAEHRTTWTDGPWQVEYVDIVSLDDFVDLHGFDQIDVLKIDVEGAEVAALNGSKRTIERYRPHLFCELLETSDGKATAELINNWLLPIGYRAYLLTADGPKLRSSVEPGPDWNHLLSMLDPDELAAAISGSRR